MLATSSQIGQQQISMQIQPTNRPTCVVWLIWLSTPSHHLQNQILIQWYWHQRTMWSCRRWGNTYGPKRFVSPSEPPNTQIKSQQFTWHSVCYWIISHQLQQPNPLLQLHLQSPSTSLPWKGCIHIWSDQAVCETPHWHCTTFTWHMCQCLHCVHRPLDLAWVPPTPLGAPLQSDCTEKEWWEEEESMESIPHSMNMSTVAGTLSK